ncbi:hypothetical protein DYB38_014235 [Aphanomyces astaci]|uniref:Uncharacterized protein n=1 Tax=Aphanomyces astaci TaxID=112090 RepID=A0A397AC64_APHAT|nr:hypothetical protein DYB36_011919 [Aphanomyces astaci]RHY76929.1 hypothetical protein DYB38_014235 [Aphanomyces astaci]
MVQIRDNFASKIGGKYDGHNLRDIINVDETVVYYDMPPGKIWAELKKSSKVDKAQKHSDRFTAVLSYNFTPTCYKCRRIPSSVTCAVHWSRCLQIAQVCVSHLT